LWLCIKLRDPGYGVGCTHVPLHFITTILAAVLAWNPMLVYSPGFQLSVAAVFGILLLRKPLQALVNHTVLRPFQKPPELLSNLLAVSLAAQIATTPIIATSFAEVSVIEVVTNLVAVPLSGPIPHPGPPRSPRR
jgi:competence protein ComEC